MGLLRYLARVLPGFIDRLLQVADFISTVWTATDGGLKKLSAGYKERRPSITPRYISPTYSPTRQVSSPPPYRAITSGSYTSAIGRDEEEDDDDGICDEDRTFFYSVKHRKPYSDYELRKWLREVQD